MIVKPHTSLKHRILGVYFKICREVAKRRDLYYVDLFAGDGEAKCEETPIKKWDSPLIHSLLKNAEKENLKLHCFLNELDRTRYEKLKEKVSSYNKYVEDIENEDANKIYKKFLENIPKNQWSIWFLDPSKHSDLKWTTIEGIANHKGWDNISRVERKPELIINFMTYTMQRSIRRNDESITEALGTDVWKEKIEKNPKTPVYEIFLKLFLDQLERLGYNCTWFSIEQTPPQRTHLYYLIFANNIPSAIKIIAEKFAPWIKRTIRDKWTKENFKWRMMTKAKKQRYKLLCEYGG